MKKILKSFASILLCIILMIPMFLFNSPTVHAAESNWWDDGGSKSAHWQGSFNFDDTAFHKYHVDSLFGVITYGYTYHMEYDIYITWTVNTTVGEPGKVGLNYEISGSTATITNTTTGKIAPEMTYYIIPFYINENGEYKIGYQRQVNGNLSSDGSMRTDNWHYLPATGVGRPDSNYMMDVDESITYDLLLPSVSRITSRTAIIDEDLIDYYTSPAGLYFSEASSTYIVLPDTQIITHEGIEIEVEFSNEYFSLDTTVYNQDLRDFSWGLCAATYAGNIESVYNGFGFGDFRTLNLEDNVYSGDTIKAYLARRILADGTELISISGCGTQSEEWAQYFKFFNELTTPALQSENGVYTNFQYACGNLYAEIMDYCGYDLSNKKFILTGHSRGAAVTNLAATVLNQVVGPENVYCYTFATPNTYLAGHTAPEANNVFNIVDGGDIVTQLPPGGSKSGQTYGYNTDEAFAMSLTGLPNLVYGVTQHTPQNYTRLIASGEQPNKQFDYQQWRWGNLHCLTDVDVVNTDGEVVASIADNIVNPDNQYLIITNNDGEKTVILPADQEFTIRVFGKADGETMEYSLYTLSENGLTEEIGPTTISFDNGDTFTAVFDRDLSSPMLEKAGFMKELEIKFGFNNLRSIIIVVVATVLILIATVISVNTYKARRRHKRSRK